MTTIHSAQNTNDISDAVAKAIIGKDATVRRNENGLYLAKTAPSAFRKALSSAGRAVGAGILSSTLFAASIATFADGNAPAVPPAVESPAPCEASLFLASPAYAQVRDINLVSDSLLTFDDPTSGLHLRYEKNRNAPFEGGNDYFSLSKDLSVGGFDFGPGIRVVKTAPGVKDTFEGDFYVGKNLPHGRLNFLTVADNTRFLGQQAWYQGRVFDFGVGVKTYDSRVCATHLEEYAGVHDPEGKVGFWLGRSADNRLSANVNVDKEDLGLFFFGKEFFDQQKRLGLLQMAFGSDGRRMGGMFSKAAGLSTVQVTADTSVHPFIGPVPSYLRNGGDRSLEAFFYEDGVHSYQGAQFGGRVASFHGVELFLGGGVTHWREGKNDSITPLVQVSTTIPTKRGSFYVDAYKTEEGLVCSGGLRVRF